MGRLHALSGLARRGWLGPLLDFGRLAPAHLRVAFLGAGFSSGILRALARRPRTAASLAHELGYPDDLVDGLAAWLDLGVALGELRRSEEGYALRSRRVRRLARRANDPVAAFYEEYAHLDHRLVVETPARLAQGRRFDLADADASIVARASRVTEPWIEAAIAAVIPSAGAVRLLEIGCGSGAHVRAACAHNPSLVAVGLELQEPAAALARAGVAEWGLADRVTVAVGDIRDRHGDADFDVATLHQNIYYFPEAEQAALLAHVATFLRPGGTVLVTSAVRGSGPAAAALDLWGAMTDGAARLPVPHEMVERMRRAGLVDARSLPLGADGLFHAFTARRPH